MKQVDVRGLDDKREITALLGITLAGEMLPTQLIYPGKTDRCHPNVTFPKHWHITHTPNHWSNTESMIEYADKLLIPFLNQKKKDLGLPKEQKSLLVLDFFSAQRNQKFVTKVEDARIKLAYVPGGCTGDLQPLDVGVNGDFKEIMKKRFSVWYASKVEAQLRNGTDIVDVNVPLNTAIIKHDNARWLIEILTELEKRQDKILSAWVKPGIFDAVHPAESLLQIEGI